MSTAAAVPERTEFVVARVLDAPRELVYDAWTEPAHLAHWWGPKGFALSACTLDLRPEGVFHYGLCAPDGAMMWGRWVFREIEPARRLAFVASFSDAEGGVTRSPFSADWPLEVLSTVDFFEKDGKTTLRLTGIPEDATEREYQAFATAHESMRNGWAGTLDRLAEYLATLTP